MKEVDFPAWIKGMESLLGYSRRAYRNGTDPKSTAQAALPVVMAMSDLLRETKNTLEGQLDAIGTVNIISSGSGMEVTVDGNRYKVDHFFSAKRAIIEFEGAHVLVDHVQNEVWELSGEPARENEKPILAAFLAPMMDRSILTVTPPDE